MGKPIHNLLCYECGKLFDPDNAVPSKGECGHIICILCLSKSSNLNCPFCGFESSFSELGLSEITLQYTEDLEEELEYEEDGFLEKKLEKILQKSDCSNCSQPTRAPRICGNCTGTLLKKVESTDKWIIFQDDTGIQSDLSNLQKICSECAYDAHEGHHTVPISKMQNLEDVLKLEFYLKLAGKGNDIAQFFAVEIRKMRKNLEKYRINREKNHTFLMDCSPQLRSFYKQTHWNIEKILITLIQLLFKKAKIYEELILAHIEHQKDILQRETSENQEEIERLIRKFEKIYNKVLAFAEICRKIVDFSKSEVEIIDQQTTLYMFEMETCFREKMANSIDLGADSKFYKFQGMKEKITKLRKSPLAKQDGEEQLDILHQNFRKLESILHSSNIIKEKEKMTSEECQKSVLKVMKNFYKRKNVRILPKSNNFLELLEWKKEESFIELVHLKFFPAMPGGDAQDAVYDMFSNL